MRAARVTVHEQNGGADRRLGRLVGAIPRSGSRRIPARRSMPAFAAPEPRLRPVAAIDPCPNRVDPGSPRPVSPSAVSPSAVSAGAVSARTVSALFQQGLFQRGLTELHCYLRLGKRGDGGDVLRQTGSTERTSCRLLCNGSRRTCEVARCSRGLALSRLPLRDADRHAWLASPRGTAPLGERFSGAGRSGRPPWRGAAPAYPWARAQDAQRPPEHSPGSVQSEIDDTGREIWIEVYGRRHSRPAVTGHRPDRGAMACYLNADRSFPGFVAWRDCGAEIDSAESEFASAAMSMARLSADAWVSR